MLKPTDQAAISDVYRKLADACRKLADSLRQLAVALRNKADNSGVPYDEGPIFRANVANL